MVKSAKIVLCVIRQILLNLIFFNGRQILLFDPVTTGKKARNDHGRNHYPKELVLLARRII